MSRAAMGCLLGVLAMCLALAPAEAAAQATDDGDEAALGAHKLATHMYNAGNFKEAAELYHTAFKLDPRPAFLFNAARSEQRIMLLDAAELHFKQVMELEGLDAATRSRVAMHLQEIATVRAALAAAQAAVVATKSPEDGQPQGQPGAKPETPPGEPALKPEPAKVAPPEVPAPAPVVPAPAAVAPPTVTVSQEAWKGTAGWASLGTGAGHDHRSAQEGHDAHLSAVL